MSTTLMIMRSSLALTAVLSLASAVRGQDLATYQEAMAEVARSSRVKSPAFLVGIGQFYCFMKVGIGDPVRPAEVLAVLHRRHPDTQPTSDQARRAQTRAVVMADLMLCPN